MHYFKHAQV